MTEDFTWLDGERLIRFGAGALSDAPSLLAQRGFESFALLTTERAVGAAPELGEAAATVLLVPPGPVPEAAAELRDGVGGLPVVALGGGRVIDSAKAIAGADGLACAAVPSTLSGAELTGFHRMPAGFKSFALVRPSLVVADPRLMASQPMPGLAASAMNALAHAAEALYTPLTSPVPQEAALRAAELLVEGLAPREPEPGPLALGGLLAGYASGAAGYAVHHVVCQTIVRVARTPHAQTNAVMLPHSLRLVAPRAPRALARLGSAVGPPTDDPQLASERVERLAARSGVTRLGQLGVEPGALSTIADEALTRPELQNTPDPPDRDELVELLEVAL